MTKKGRLPQTKSGKKDKFLDTAQAFVTYGELLRLARIILKQDGRLNEQNWLLDIRLQVESDFCFNAVLNLFGLDKDWIRKVLDGLYKDKESFTEEAMKFADNIIGSKKKLRLYTSDDLKKEIVQQGEKRKMQKRLIDPKKEGGILVK